MIVKKLFVIRKRDNMEEIYIKKEDLTEWCVRDVEKTLGYKVDNLISVADLVSIIEDLLGAIENLQDEYDNLKQDIEDNYKPMSVEEQIGWSERW